MKLTQTENRLILQDTPGCLWFLAFFFMSIGGIFVYGAVGGFQNSDRQPSWVLVAAFLMGASGIAAGLWLIYNSPLTKFVIDRVTDEVIVTKRNIFGTTEAFYAFEEIKHFRLLEGVDDEGVPVWSVGMELNDGEIIKVTSLSMYSDEFERKYVYQTNEFMRKQMPSLSDVFESE